MLRFIFGCFIAMCLCSCATKTRHEFVMPERVPLNTQSINPIKLEPVKFIIIHKDNADATFTKLQSEKVEPILFGLTGKDYKNLSINIEKLKSYIILQRSVIKKYKEYYEGKHDKAK